MLADLTIVKSKMNSRIFFTEGISNPKQQRLTQDDVTNQGRYLLNNFIYERMQKDGLENVPGMEQLQEPGTPSGQL